MYRDPEPTISKVCRPGILNKHLTAMLKAERLCSTGVKAEMQTRVIAQLRKYATSDPVAFDRLKAMIDNPRQHDMPDGAYSPRPNVAYESRNPVYPNAAGASAQNGGLPYEQQSVFRGNGINIDFKPSPFYKFQKQIGDIKICDRMDQHRHSVSININMIEHPDLTRIDPNTRILVFCAAGSGLGRQDVAFPHQSEIKVNGVEYKKSLRGVKNKPGTTRPADITNMLRLTPKCSNVVELTYALTKERYYLLIKVVKMVSVEELAKGIASGKKITKASVINEMINKARDPDIVVGSSKMSLKCPLSTLRINLPCRATTCKHTQCFDAISFLQLQEQGPTWVCPICNNPVAFENLAVDEYFREILEKTPKNIDQVTIEPNGVWSQSKPKTMSPPRFSSGSGDEDDEIVEIKDSRVTALKNGSIGSGSSSSIHLANTPPGSSREPSISSVGPPKSSSRKRSAAAVIDLTLSDDEDEPARPAKRVQYVTPGGGVSNGNTPNGVPHRAGYMD